jgi:tetratricopeptide (TPR) repeat protein
MLAGGAAYQNSFGGVFQFDDRESILNNTTIRHLGDWRAILHPPQRGVTVSGRPGLNLSFALNWAWSGDHIGSYHAVNLAGHLAAALLLFGLARRTLARVDALRNVATPLGFATALLWVLHPLQTESVTYIVQRAEMLMALAYLATLYCVARCAQAAADGRRRASGVWSGAAILICAFGMTCKEVMVSAPVIALLYVILFWSDGWRAALKRHALLWVGLALTWIPLTLGVLSTHNRGGTAGFGAGLKIWQYWWTQGPAIARYLGLTLWPHPLVLDYGFEKHWVTAPWTALPANLAIGLVALTVLVTLWRAPRWGFLGFWFFSILATTTLVPGNRQSLAEHRMYLALAPLLAAVVIGAWWALRRQPKLAGAILAVLAVAEVLTTRARNRDYYTEERMWREAIAAAPANSYAYTNLGATLYLNHRNEEAQAEFLQAIKLDANYAAPESNLAMTYQDAGEFDRAIQHYRRALQIDPNYPQALSNLGVTLASQGHWAEAEACYAHALKINPIYADAESNWGIAAQNLGQFAEADRHFQRSLEIEPNQPQLWYRRGSAMRQSKHNDAAIECFARAIQLQPNYSPAQVAWGQVLFEQGRLADALAHFNAAVAADPADADGYLNRGVVLAAAGHNAEAAAQYQAALKLRPAMAEAWADLGTLQLAAGQAGQAVVSLKAAASSDPKNAQIHYDYSLALAATGREAAAAAEIQTALQLDPTLAEARNNYAVSLARHGNLAAAAHQLELLVQQHPEFANAHRNLGLIYRSQGRTQDAQRETDRAQALGLPAAPGR